MLELIHVGHSAKSRGIDGTFKARILEQFKEVLCQSRAVFININGSKVPFLIESCADKGDILLKLEEITSPEEVSHLLNKELYLDRVEVPQEVLDKVLDNTHPLTHYEILNESGTLIGNITEIVEYPEQLMAKLDYKNKPILIPIHEDLIVQISESEQQITMQIPDGLLDL